MQKLVAFIGDFSLQESKTSSFNSDLVALELFLAVELLIQADPGNIGQRQL